MCREAMNLIVRIIQFACLFTFRLIEPCFSNEQAIDNKENVSNICSEYPLIELLRSGARKLITDAVEIELQELLSQYSHLKIEFGHEQIVRNGYLPERKIQTGVGPVKVRVPKKRDQSGQGIMFNSALLPPYLRKTKSVEEVLPWFIQAPDLNITLALLCSPKLEEGVQV